MPDIDEKMVVTVQVRTATRVDRYRILIPKEHASSEEHCQGVIGAGIEMACALLDAPYTKAKD